MTIVRDPTGETAAAICNHPDVRPTMGSDPDYHFDFRDHARDPRWYLLLGAPPIGTYVCVRLLDGVYEAHAAILPQGRGPWALGFAEEAIRYMFTTTDAIEILTRVPQGHLACHTLVQRLWFVPRWTRPSIRFRGQDVPFTVWGLSMFDWFPAEDTEVRTAVLDEMRAAGQKAKAEAWGTRYAYLSLEPTL